MAAATAKRCANAKSKVQYTVAGPPKTFAKFTRHFVQNSNRSGTDQALVGVEVVHYIYILYIIVDVLFSILAHLSWIVFDIVFAYLPGGCLLRTEQQSHDLRFSKPSRR